MSALAPFFDTIIKYVWQPRRGGDFVDRLNYRVTVTLLISCALVIFAKDYGGDPLKCWGRAEWRDGWMEYAHDYCFIESTYFVPLSDPRIPAGKDFRRMAQLDYYQWVPFLLLLQALSYLVPERIWKTFNSYSGIMVGRVTSSAADASKEGGGIDMKVCDHIVTQLSNALNVKAFLPTVGEGKRKKRSRIRRFLSVLWSLIDPSRLRGSLTAIYFLTKLLLIANSTIQFFFLGYFLGRTNPTFGWDAVNALTDGDDWRDTGLFPRVTLCDFKVRGLRNRIETYTVQCVLMGNMVNEKIFISLWWWMLILDTVTAMNLTQWIFKVCRKQKRKDFVRESLFPSVDLLYPLPIVKKVTKSGGKKDGENGGEKGGEMPQGLNEKKEVLLEAPLPSTAEECKEKAEEWKEKIKECKKKVEETKKKIEDCKKDMENCGEEMELHEKKLELLEAQLELLEKQLGKYDWLWDLLQKREKFSKRIAYHQSDFVKYLGTDGVLIMDLIERNSNQIVASAVMGKLFENYCDFVEENPLIAQQFLQDD